MTSYPQTERSITHCEPVQRCVQSWNIHTYQPHDRHKNVPKQSWNDSGRQARDCSSWISDVTVMKILNIQYVARSLKPNFTNSAQLHLVVFPTLRWWTQGSFSHVPALYNLLCVQLN